MPCVTCGSCCGSPSSTRLRAQGLIATASASDTCPASLAVYRRKLDELDALIGELEAVREQIGLRLALAESEPPLCELGGREL